MSTAIPHIQEVIPPVLFLNARRNARPGVWWGPVWRGLFVDPTGKHYRAMGRSLWLYGYLIVHANRETGTLYRKVSTVARDIQVSERTVQTWLSLLRRHGYIRTRTTGRALAIRIEKWRPVVKGARQV